jgi:ubiquinone/menaquinone biosynthesis C-methylase UbiE
MMNMPHSSLRALLVLSLVVLAGAATPARQLASRSTEEWIKTLESPARIKSLRVDEVIAKLRLMPGNVVADLGAGAGAFSLPLAKAVGPTGKVYAVDIDRGLVDYIGRKAAAEKLTNVEPVLGRFTDPALPAADVDVAFLHDVLHHIEDRAAYLKNAARYLKPRGRVAVVDFDGPTGPHSTQPTLQITRTLLGRWMDEAGLALAEELPSFDGKWYVIYAKK